MKKNKILEGNALYTIIAIVIGFIVGAVVIGFGGLNPGVVYGKLVDGIFGKPKYLFNSVVYAIPLILAGLSVAFSFRTGVFNIGAEGQFVVGALVSCVLGIKLDLPSWIVIPVCLLSAAAAGAIWSSLSAIMKVTRGINEVLSFIMLNWIAFYLSNYVVNLKGIKADGREATVDILPNASIKFPQAVLDALDCDTFNWGIVIAIAAAILIWYIINKTTLGYELRAVGYNKYAATYGGINSNRAIVTAMAISGALAGLAGATQILGNAGRIAQFAGQEGYGFQGITVALIGGSDPIGCIFAGLFYGAMKYGGSKLGMVHAPKEILDIIMGTVVIFIAVSHVFRNLFYDLISRSRQKKEAKAAKAASSAPESREAK